VDYPTRFGAYASVSLRTPLLPVLSIIATDLVKAGFGRLFPFLTHRVSWRGVE